MIKTRLLVSQITVSSVLSKCRLCGQNGHYAMCCRSKTRARNRQSAEIGQFESVLKVGSCEQRECMYVVDQTNALLSRNACVKLELISYHVNGVNTHEFIGEFKPLFEGL